MAKGPLLDLASLQDVKLQFRDTQSLQLTAGSWQSLEDISSTAFSIAFSGRRQFVTGTKEFQSMGVKVMIKNTVQAVKMACAMWSIDCCELRCPDVRLMRNADDQRE